MAITYPLNFPSSPGFTKANIFPVPISGRTLSEFTGEQQIYGWDAGLWKVELELPPMIRATAEPWIETLIALWGKKGTVLWFDPAGTSPRGSAPGSPQVDGASQTGITLNTKGWTASQTGILLQGDWISVGSGATTRLHKNLTDANSDGTGKATLDIFPPIRESPADSAAITTSSAKGTFGLLDPEWAWDLDLVKTFGLNFTLLEAYG
jgi:hypothetical protein